MQSKKSESGAREVVVDMAELRKRLKAEGKRLNADAKLIDSFIVTHEPGEDLVPLTVKEISSTARDIAAKAKLRYLEHVLFHTQTPDGEALLIRLKAWDKKTDEISEKCKTIGLHPAFMGCFYDRGAGDALPSIKGKVAMASVPIIEEIVPADDDRKDA